MDNEEKYHGPERRKQLSRRQHDMLFLDGHLPHRSTRSIIGIRVTEAVIIAMFTAVATAAGTGYVALRVLESKAADDRAAIQELKSSMQKSTESLNDLSRSISSIETKIEERKFQTEMRLRALEDRKR